MKKLILAAVTAATLGLGFVATAAPAQAQIGFGFGFGGGCGWGNCYHRHYWGGPGYYNPGYDYGYRRCHWVHVWHHHHRVLERRCW